MINSLNRQILHGDVLDKLKEIPTESIDCIISSPPYWGLRDYQVDGQIGFESNFKDYLKILSNVMDQLKRVLKNSGTCWINLGDTYASGGGKSVEQTLGYKDSNCKKEQDYSPKSKYRTTMGKSRFGIPERFYINCIDSGWIARNNIIWYKSNTMPQSVKDRFANKYEFVFFFAKTKKYYFNLDAVREKTITESKPFNIRVRENITGHNERQIIHKQDSTLGIDGKPKVTYKGFNKRWKLQNQHRDSEGKNPGDIFFINPKPIPSFCKNCYEDIKIIILQINDKDTKCCSRCKIPVLDHHASFPVELPLKILKCACPPNGIVLDCFFGAGTTGMAAEQLGLQWCGIELKEEYIKLAKKRLEPYLNRKLDGSNGSN